MNAPTRNSQITQKAPPHPNSPYKGLTPYDEQDAPFFFGREEDTRIISANLVASRLTLLYGPSGVGKSSVLRAGVASALRAESQRNLQRKRARADFFVVVFDRWRDDPITGLYAAIQEQVNLVLPSANLVPRSSFVETLDAWTDVLGTGRAVFAGDGALRYAPAIRARLADRALIPGDAPALAGAIGLLAAADPGRAVTPHAVVPLYVRRPDVELTRERLGDLLLDLRAALATPSSWPTTLLVTHSVVEAVRLADRVLVFSDRPARILDDAAVPLPRPRGHGQPEFGAWVERLTSVLACRDGAARPVRSSAVA